MHLLWVLVFYLCKRKAVDTSCPRQKEENKAKQQQKPLKQDNKATK